MDLEQVMSPENFIYNGAAHGTIASRLVNAQFNAAALRPWIKLDKMGNPLGAFITVNGKNIPVPVGNATLRKDEWKHYDQAILDVVRDRLIGVADLNSRGLTYNIPNGLGSTVLEYEDMSDVNPASFSMDGLNRGDDDKVEFDLNYLPLPICHADFNINARYLAASRSQGRPLDTTMAEKKGRKIAEALESLLFVGTGGITYGGGTIYGYMNHPDRNTYSLTANWDESTATGAGIIGDTRGMKQALIDAKYYGPYVLYIPTNYETVMDDNYTTNYPETIRERIMKIDGIQDVKVSDKLTADNVLLVQMSSDVVRMVEGLPVTTLQWDEVGGLKLSFKIMTIQVPQIRSDQDGNCGVCHAS